MPKLITGGCLCGEIRYECQEEPSVAIICHCIDCQRFTGSAFAPELRFSKASFRIVSGTPSGHVVAAESGNSVERQFCSRCGASLFAVLDKYPDVISVHAGSLDDTTLFRPRFQVWTRTQMDGIRVNDEIETFKKSRDAG